MIISILVLELLYFFIQSKNRYTKALSYIKKEEYSIKKLLPIGLLFMETINYSYTSNYDRQLYKKFYTLKGKEQANFYRMIHWAEKVVYFQLTLLLVLGFSLFIPVDAIFIVFTFVLLILSIMMKDKELDLKIEKNNSLIKIEFAEFINQLSLLVGAGLTVTSAWAKIAERNDEKHPLYHGVMKVQKSLNKGVSFNHALETFAMDYQTKEISRFVSVLIQNYIKGSDNIVITLDQQANEALESRKREAMIIGERANTKLLFPMMLILIAIFIMLSIPAMLMFAEMV
jgi:tight adherence protein C